MPAMPWPLFVDAAISPATNVPCPFVSRRAEPPTKLFASAILPSNSGCSPSMPESTTATRTGTSGGAFDQASKARIRVRYHWRAASGSFGEKESRREGSHPLDPGNSGQRPEAAGGGRVDRDREGADRRDGPACTGLEPVGKRLRRGALVDSHRVPGRGCRRRREERERERERCERDAPHAGPIRTIGLTPGTNPAPERSLAR